MRESRPRVPALILVLAWMLILALPLPGRADSPHTDPDHPHLPGELGPDDTRVLVFQASGQPPGTSSARILFTPEFQDFSVTFTVYRHAYGDDTPFERGVFLALSSCTLTQAEYEAGNLGSCPGWEKDALYGYLSYTDPLLTDYEEYSYLVHSSEEGVDDPDEFLEGYVVVRAFPPHPDPARELHRIHRCLHRLPRATLLSEPAAFEGSQHHRSLRHLP